MFKPEIKITKKVNSEFSLEKNFEEAELKIPCPECGQQLPVKMKEAINENVKIKCPTCHNLISLDTTSLKQSLTDVSGSLKNLFK